MLYRILSFLILFPSFLCGICLSTVIWDAGHGHPDGGASGQMGSLEKDITLSIASVANEFSIFIGLPSCLTRNGDEAIYSAEAKTIRQKKISDLHNRLRIANSVTDPIFISIHTNAASSGISGLQTFYAPSASSDQLSLALTNRFSSCLPLQRVRGAVKSPEHVFLTRKLACPAVIVEYGFITNLREEGLLTTPAYQKRLSFLTLCGLLDFINEKGA